MRLSRKTLIISAVGFFSLISAAYAGLPWSWDMWLQDSIKPYEDPVVFPQQSVNTEGDRVVLQDREEIEKITENPFDATEESIEKGKLLFDHNCTPCHGPEGHGDGIIVKKGLGFYPVDLAGAATVARTDGFIYAYIRYGGKVIMPSYSESISEDDAWHVVNYVRKLQGNQ